MARVDGGEMLVRVLEQEGVKQIFGLHGGHVDPIFQACAATTSPSTTPVTRPPPGTWPKAGRV